MGSGGGNGSEEGEVAQNAPVPVPRRSPKGGVHLYGGSQLSRNTPSWGLYAHPRDSFIPRGQGSGEVVRGRESEGLWGVDEGREASKEKAK